MAEAFFNFSRIAWLIGIALLVLIANVVASILYMVVYSYVIDPGHDAQYYNDHIQNAAPYCSIIAGIPLMFLAGWLVGRWWRGEFAVKSAIVIWFIYTIVDLAIIAAAGATAKIGILVGISLLTKLIAAYAGAIFARGSAVV